MQRLQGRIERVSTLIRHQGTVQHALWHADLQLHTFDGSAERRLRSDSDVKSAALFATFECQAVSDVYGNGHDALRTNMIGHEPEVAIRRYEGQHAFGFPSLESDARME